MQNKYLQGKHKVLPKNTTLRGKKRKFNMWYAFSA